jgi:hypothetical protein
VCLTQLAIALWQCSGSFITPDPEFPGQTRHSSCSPRSLISRHGSLWFLVVPQIEAATEGFPFWQPRGHASSSGRNVGLSVWSHKGTTLKGIRNWAPQVCNFFSWPNVGYFLDRVVHTRVWTFVCVCVCVRERERFRAVLWRYLRKFSIESSGSKQKSYIRAKLYS